MTERWIARRTYEDVDVAVLLFLLLNQLRIPLNKFIRPTSLNALESRVHSRSVAMVAYAR